MDCNHDASNLHSWRTSLKEYEHQKRKIPDLPKIERITNSTVNRLEGIYNPLLQTYTDRSAELFYKEQEQRKMIETLAKNQDRALRYEQTFNVINLENKLKGLEGLPGYPIEKLPNYKNRKLGNTTNTNYNIISCLDLADHHFLPPEKRPLRPVIKEKTYKLHAVEYRDYNIITNTYLQKHEEKSRVDLESYKQEAAREYWKTHDFDPIRCTYLDQEKEKAFIENCKEREKVHGLDKIDKLPHGVKYSEGALYQPIGMKVVDKKRLEEIDLKEKNSKQRYETRYDIEKDYREKDIFSQEMKKSQTLKRISHDRHVETEKRGYNILTHAPFQGLGAEELRQPFTSPKITAWEKAVIETEKHQSAPLKSSSVKFLRTTGFI